MNARKPTFNQMGTIDVEIEHPKFGWLPFTASPDDVEEQGRELFKRAQAGEFGQVAPYVPPVPQA